MTFIALLIITDAYTQDIIIFKDGEEIKAKVVEIGTDEIKYKKWPPSEDSPVYVERKNNIFMIKYADGTKDVFKETTSEQSEISSIAPLKISALDASIAGEKDALEHHKAGGNFLLGLGFGVFGIIGVAVTNNPRPPDLARIPEPRLAQNLNYLSAYKKRAHKKNIGMSIVGTITAGAIILLSAQ